jgi:uncharacterized protein
LQRKREQAVFSLVNTVPALSGKEDNRLGFSPSFRGPPQSVCKALSQPSDSAWSARKDAIKIERKMRKMKEAVMAATRPAATFSHAVASHRFLSGTALFAAAVLVATVPAQAQEPQSPPQARVIVIGEGSVSVPPDYARIRSGVTTRAKTASGATDANSKLMTAVTAALVDAGIAQKDIRTSQFSIQPIYAPREPHAEAKLSGFSVSNQVSVTIRQIAKVGEILDRLVTAGVTDVGNIVFLLSDPSEALDQARAAAIADARRKAEVYAHASGLTLGRVAWITEDSGYGPSIPMGALRASAAMARTVPISTGENELHVTITVGFDIAH